MKQEIKTTEAIFPMPVLMISTFNEDGSVDVMNAAWGTMLDRDKVALNLTETHKTVQNIKARKGFVVHIADAKHVVEADYFGVVSGNAEKDKFAKSGMTYTKSDLVDAPIINEFPIAMECEFIEYQSDDTGLGVIGKVLRTSVEEANMKDGKVGSLYTWILQSERKGRRSIQGRLEAQVSIGQILNDLKAALNRKIYSCRFIYREYLFQCFRHGFEHHLCGCPCGGYVVG